MHDGMMSKFQENLVNNQNNIDGITNYLNTDHERFG